MSTLLALEFDSEDGAAQMRDRLLSLQKQHLITIDDTAISASTEASMEASAEQ
jgi:uncharacterized membrane protein